VRLLHSLARTHASFDDPNLVSRAGLVPVIALARRAGALASLAKARGATLRRDLIDVAARAARSGRGHITLHLPDGWHREHEWMTLFQAACVPPAPVA
jgi:hypothetical protein